MRMYAEKRIYMEVYITHTHECIHIYTYTDIHTRSALTAEVITECGPTTVNPVTNTKTAQQNINHYICMYVHMIIITIILYLLIKRYCTNYVDTEMLFTFNNMLCAGV